MKLKNFIVPMVEGDCDQVVLASDAKKLEQINSALEAVAEAALKCETALQQHLLGSERLTEADIKIRLEWALKSTQEALANLAAIREQKVEGGK